jgi:WD40 repeat protein
LAAAKELAEARKRAKAQKRLDYQRLIEAQKLEVARELAHTQPFADAIPVTPQSSVNDNKVGRAELLENMLNHLDAMVLQAEEAQEQARLVPLTRQGQPDSKLINEETSRVSTLISVSTGDLTSVAGEQAAHGEAEGRAAITATEAKVQGGVSHPRVDSSPFRQTQRFDSDHGRGNPVYAVAFSPDDRRLASASGTSLKIWKSNGQGLFMPWQIIDELPRRFGFRAELPETSSLAFSNYVEKLASGHDGKTIIRKFDERGIVDKHHVLRHSGLTRSVAFSPNGTKLIFCTNRKVCICVLK